MLTEAVFHSFFAATLLSQTVRDAAALGLLALLAIERLTGKTEALPATWLRPVVAFLGVNLLSAWWSADPAASFEQLRFYPIGLLVFLGARRVVAAGGFYRVSAVVLGLIVIFGADEISQFLRGRSLLREQAPVWGRFQGSLVFPSDVSL
ncbi:MAG: hypothetical protein ACREQQ_12265, partial [Candidatus Binatia bacterium]